MNHVIKIAFAVFMLTASLRPAVGDEFRFLDLQMRKNQELSKEFGNDGREGNTLEGLPTGKKELLGVQFKIGKGVVHLGSTVQKDRPEKVEGISVSGSFAKLHILHATQYGGGPNKEGAAWFVKDGTLIGQYKVNYEDQTVETIPIVYGKDVRDWWFRPDEAGVTRGRVAWEGDNEVAKNLNCRLRLYVNTWENPKPRLKVVSIDFLSKMKETVASPFCVAITLEK